MSRTVNRGSKSRAIVRVRADGSCEICGTELDSKLPQTDRRFPSIHHRFPRRDGGCDFVSNMLRLCKKCHTDVIHGDEEFAYLFGWMAHANNTSRIPVMTRHGWVLMTEDGSFESLPYHSVPELTKGHARDIA